MNGIWELFWGLGSLGLVVLEGLEATFFFLVVVFVEKIDRPKNSFFSFFFVFFKNL